MLVSVLPVLTTKLPRPITCATFSAGPRRLFQYARQPTTPTSPPSVGDATSRCTATSTRDRVPVSMNRHHLRGQVGYTRRYAILCSICKAFVPSACTTVRNGWTVAVESTQAKLAELPTLVSFSRRLAFSTPQQGHVPFRYTMWFPCRWGHMAGWSQVAPIDRR